MKNRMETLEKQKLGKWKNGAWIPWNFSEHGKWKHENGTMKHGNCEN